MFTGGVGGGRSCCLEIPGGWGSADRWHLGAQGQRAEHWRAGRLRARGPARAGPATCAHGERAAPPLRSEAGNPSSPLLGLAPGAGHRAWEAFGSALDIQWEEIASFPPGSGKGTKWAGGHILSYGEADTRTRLRAPLREHKGSPCSSKGGACVLLLDRLLMSFVAFLRLVEEEVKAGGDFTCSHQQRGFNGMRT